MELVCIVCPRGCRLTAQKTADDISVKGNSCPRGAAFAKEELTCPMRTLTTTVRTAKGDLARLPVRTDGEIPKTRLAEAMKELNQIVVRPPVRCGSVIYQNLLGVGVDVIATAPLTKKEETHESSV